METEKYAKYLVNMKYAEHEVEKIEKIAVK